MKKIKIGKNILTVMLSLIMVLQLFMPAISFVFAAGYEYEGGAGIKVSDLDTSTKYTESLGDNASTEFSGRVWTDKSVYDSDVTFDTFGGGTTTIKLNENNNGEDFLVAYSALATSETVSGQTQAPVDVVLILDISGSMSNADSNMDNNRSRIYNAVQAANNAIEKLMALNEYTRVAVYAFSTNAQEILPLDRYTKAQNIEREWVSTGFFSGYWKETTVDVPYFSVNPESASNNYATLTAVAVNSNNTRVQKSVSVEGGTNIQMGLYEGMSVLANEDETTVNINGQTVNRVPSVILLSDGSPTYSSSSTSWWAPSDNADHGPGSQAYAGNGFKAILVGSYMKDAINRNYNTDRTTVYTVGMGITELSDNEKNLAYMTLDPTTHWDSSASNTMKTTIKGYWNNYIADNGNITVNVGQYNDRRYSDRNVTLTHPTTAYDVNDYAYVDDYYDADNASAVTDVFNEIVSNISISAPQVPTEIKGTDPLTDGYITYTDPIGDFMEIKDVKAIIYAGTTFTNKQVNGSTYVFQGEVHSPVYGDCSIENIIITVDETKNELVIKIPASVIPLRVNTVVLNSDGTVKQHTNNGAFPARVVYSVGLKSEFLKEAADGSVYVDRAAVEAVDADYFANNTNADGTVNFYTNIYTGETHDHEHTVGNATAEFEPSHTNGFYYILEDMPIYKDADFTQQVTVAEGIDDNTIYYYRDEYYHGASTEIDPVQRTGLQLKKTEIVTGEDGYLYRAAGSPRLNRILKFEGRKTANATGTAEAFYAPSFHYAENNPNAYDGKFVVYLGNNGRITMSAGGNLEITKTVVSSDGLVAPDKEFEFTIDLGNDTYEHNYKIVDENGAEISSGTVSAAKNKILLKDAQKAIIYALPPSLDYAVTETPVNGFTTQSSGAIGTIAANSTSVASFVNTYSVTPVTFPTDGDLTVTKRLEGRDWDANDKFAFMILPYSDSPLPEGYNAETGVVISAPDNKQQKEVTFNFGKINFTKPGVYRYTVFESEPEISNFLPGMTYSRALYRIVINVVDNLNGTLSVDSYDIQKLNDDNANPLFTIVNGEIVMNSGEEAQDDILFVNTYNAKSVTRVPIALKEYTDNSGANPLLSGMFNFKLQAVGYSVENGVWVNDITKVPMPIGTDANGVIETTNEGHNIAFGSIEYDQDDIPEGKDKIIFKYQMSEIAGTDTHATTYDGKVYEIEIHVSINAGGDTLDVHPVYLNNGNEEVITFKNTYTPVAVNTDIDGVKTLVGRNMKAGERFEFTLSGADAITENAIADGSIVIPNNVSYIEGAQNSVAKAFAFNNVEFKKIGTYTFNVAETKGNEGGVDYDDSVVKVEVVVSDNNGYLTVTSKTYNNGKDYAEFVNTYTSSYSGEAVNLEGTKNLTGKALLGGEFYFVVREEFNGNAVATRFVTHEKDDSAESGVYSATVKFLSNVEYDKVGTYTYYISEQIPAEKAGGITYDTKSFRYVVTVEDDMNGNIKVTSKSLQVNNGGVWENASGNIVFTNTYKPAPTTASLPIITKIIAGDRAAGLSANEFEFKLERITVSDGMQLPAEVTARNDAEGKISFGEITFTKTGVYQVAVSEIIPDDTLKAAGITYSTQKIVATYNVTDNGNGALSAVLVQYTGGDAFVNEYVAEPAEVEIEINKVLEGRNWETTDSFEFEVVVLDPDTKNAIENGAIEFPLDSSDEEIETKAIDYNTPAKTVTGKIKINRPGTYEFIVREKTGIIPGIHYDSQPRIINIVATDDSVNAKIDTAVTVTVDGNVSSDLKLVFKNVYDASSTELSGHDHLTINKVFTGRHNNEWLDTDAFEFELKAAADTQAAVDAGDVELPFNRTIVLTNANKAHPHFGNIIFHKEGVYSFVITEKSVDGNGITYDTQPRTVKVKVYNDTANAVLVAEIMQDSDELTFTNTYSADSVTVKGSETLKVTKSLIGRDWFSSDKFTFTINPYDAATSQAIANNNVIMPALNEVSATAAAGNKEDVTVHFGDIEFTKAGTYRFVIEEKAGNIENVVYDTHTYGVVITVTDNNNGKLEASASYYSSPIFVNSYNAPVVTEMFKGKKNLAGRDLAENEFAFNITAETANAPMPKNTTVYNTANGEINFGEIKFDTAGTYVYKISEVNNDLSGVDYDTTDVYATVTVEYNSATGTLSSVVKYKKGENGAEEDTFAFNNTYTAAASEEISLKAVKTVKSDAVENFTLKGNEFKFAIRGLALTTSGVAPMPEKEYAYNDANGNIDFGTVKFSEAGTYKYTIFEADNALTYYEYDAEQYTVVIKVKDDTENAKFVIESIKTVNSVGNEEAAVFENKYTPKKTSALIFGLKKLNSEHKNLAPEFEFEINAVTPNAPMPANTTVKNTVNNTETGTFQFLIAYEKTGEYKYRITEKNGGKYGYTYDDTEYFVTVKVTDVADGQLRATVEGVGTEINPAIVFTNYYVPDAVKVTLGEDKELSKSISGRDLNDNEFEFALLDENQDEIDTSKNNKKGFFELEAEFTKAGTYNYTIIEKDNALGGVTYDKAVYGVEIEVTDNNGKLEIADVTYTLENTEVEEVVFNNSYKAEKTNITITATKKLNGRDLKDNEFKFVLKDKDGKVVALATNDKEGNIIFDKVELNEAKTYKFTLSEEKGTLENITYDDTEYTIEVKVNDDGEGKLTAEEPVVKKAGKLFGKVKDITFTNTYTAPKPESTNTGDNSSMFVWFALLIASGVLFGAVMVMKKKNKN